MDLRLLRYFLTVAETLHFGRAAEQLHIAQPPLSRAVRQLEHELDVTLFNRTTRQVELTPAGELLRREAIAIFASIDETVARVQAIGAGTAGTLRVGLTGSTSYGVLPALARLVKDRLPGVKLQIRTEMLTPVQTRALLEDRIDVGVLRPPVRAEGLSHELLYSEPLVLALPERHRLAGDPDVTVADLRFEDFVTYSDATRSVLNDAVIRSCLDAGFYPHREHQVEETSTMLALVAAGLGVALVPASAQAVALHGLTFMNLPDAAMVSVAIAWREDDDSPLLRALLDCIHDIDLPELSKHA